MFSHPESGFSRDGFRFFVNYDISLQGMSLYISRMDPCKLLVHTQIGTIVWKDHPEECGDYIAPTLVCAPESMQHMFNALWELGFRPSGAVTPDAITAAKDAHIADLRKVVTTLLQIEKDK